VSGIFLFATKALTTWCLWQKTQIFTKERI